MSQQQLWDHIDKHRDDWDARRILADWMEEHDDPIGARGQRWQVENKKHPIRLLYTDGAWIATAKSLLSRQAAWKWGAQASQEPHALPRRVFTACQTVLTYRFPTTTLQQSEGKLAHALELIRTKKVRFTQNDTAVLVMNVFTRKNCIHSLERVYDTHSWPYLCIKCGARTR